jgi:hypothetical protein
MSRGCNYIATNAPPPSMYGSGRIRGLDRGTELVNHRSAERTCLPRCPQG